MRSLKTLPPYTIYPSTLRYLYLSSLYTVLWNLSKHLHPFLFPIISYETHPKGQTDALAKGPGCQAGFSNLAGQWPVGFELSPFLIGQIFLANFILQILKLGNKCLFTTFLYYSLNSHSFTPFFQWWHGNKILSSFSPFFQKRVRLFSIGKSCNLTVRGYIKEKYFNYVWKALVWTTHDHLTYIINSSLNFIHKTISSKSM